MANIEIVIKIPEKDYESIKYDVKKFSSMPSHKVPVLYEAINKGIVLPKGHGDLKDADRLKLVFSKWSPVVEGCFSDYDVATIIHRSPIIIESDKEDKE